MVITIEPPPFAPGLPRVPGCCLVGRAREAIAFILDNEEQPNRPPHISILSPPNGAVFLAPTDVRIIANTGGRGRLGATGRVL